MSEREFNEIFAANLNHYMKVTQTTRAELAQLLGVSVTSVANWCNAVKTPRMDKVDRICQHFGILRSDLMQDNSQEDTHDRAYPTIPVLGAIAAGEPILMSEHEIDRIPFYPNYRENLFALVVKGESMAPRIQDGDLIVAIAQNDVNNGEIAIVAVNGDEATCKRVYKSPEGITLVADNAAVYPPHFYGPSDEPIQVLGKVIEIRARA